MGKLIKFLVESSKPTLQDFKLRQLAERTNLRKELIEVLDECIEAEAKVRFAEYLLEELQLAAPKLVEKDRLA